MSLCPMYYIIITFNIKCYDYMGQLAKYLMLYTIIRKRPKKTAQTSSPVPLLVALPLVEELFFWRLPEGSRHVSLD